jgi:hypothetical protein
MAPMAALMIAPLTPMQGGRLHYQPAFGSWSFTLTLSTDMRDIWIVRYYEAEVT